MIQGHVFWLCLLMGLGTWALRYLPMLWGQNIKTGGWVARLMSATGPAAIMTLFTASILPELTPPFTLQLPLGVIGTILVFYLRRSVVAATLCGAATYGLAGLLM